MKSSQPNPMKQFLLLVLFSVSLSLTHGSAYTVEVKTGVHLGGGYVIPLGEVGQRKATFGLLDGGLLVRVAVPTTMGKVSLQLDRCLFGTTLAAGYGAEWSLGKELSLEASAELLGGVWAIPPYGNQVFFQTGLEGLVQLHWQILNGPFVATAFASVGDRLVFDYVNAFGGRLGFALGFRS